MSQKAEYDAAYFTYLRAVEEYQDLQRYREYLEREHARLDTFTEATRTAADELPRRVRRPIDSTQRPLLEAVGRRRALVLEESGRMEDRIAAATDFVQECQAEVARLRT